MKEKTFFKKELDGYCWKCRTSVRMNVYIQLQRCSRCKIVFHSGPRRVSERWSLLCLLILKSFFKYAIWVELLLRLCGSSLLWVVVYFAHQLRELKHLPHYTNTRLLPVCALICLAKAYTRQDLFPQVLQCYVSQQYGLVSCGPASRYNN